MFERECERVGVREYLSHTLPTVSVCGSDLGEDGRRPVRSLALSRSLSHSLPHTHTLSHTRCLSHKEGHLREDGGRPVLRGPRLSLWSGRIWVEREKALEYPRGSLHVVIIERCVIERRKAK